MKEALKFFRIPNDAVFQLEGGFNMPIEKFINFV